MVLREVRDIFYVQCVEIENNLLSYLINDVK